MNCKNCEVEISELNVFCANCGGKVVRERVSVKILWKEFAATILGWDNKYFFTLRMMLFRPKQILKEYLAGTRKKYVSPLAFFALGAAIALIVFNVFVEDYVVMGNAMNEFQLEPLYDLQKSAGNTIDFETFKNDMKVQNENITRNIIKYFNLLSFVLLPIFTLISFLVFWKRNFYGEQLVINAFIQGITFWFSIIAFGLAMLFNIPSIFTGSSVLVVLFYLYVYRSFYELKFRKLFLYTLKFFGVLLGFVFVIGILMFIGGLLYATFTGGV
ncbi:MAG: hypothetical protein COB81_10680 [Flavobacteriaceae bacterium]|nr:MAG: hypothetical protein COB81_10680 [Flavobacteriaceae bacterium]